MKCPNCGFESELTYPVCPQCQMETQPNPAAGKILTALKDSLFLVICILMSATCVLSMAADNLPLINILITVFLWLTYAKSKKDIADTKHLRCVSGAVYANYVVVYVAAGIVAVAGVLLALLSGFLLSDPSFLEMFVGELAELDQISNMIALVPSGLIMAIFLIVAAGMVVLNIFSQRYIHRFAKSVYQSIEAGNLNLQHANAAKIWLFIFGVLSAVGSLSSLADGNFLLTLSGVAESGAAIFAGILISRHLFDGPAPSVLTNYEVDKATSVFADHQQFLDSDIR